MTIPYTDLSPDQQVFVDAMIESYLDQIGHPPHLTRQRSRDAIIHLLETGRAKFIYHGDRDDPACEISLELCEAPHAAH